MIFRLMVLTGLFLAFFVIGLIWLIALENKSK